MKAFYKLDVGRYAFRDIAEPMIMTPEDVKIQVKYCTICADETKDLGVEDYFSKEQIMGHEMSGIIVELGQAAKEKGFAVGDHVSGVGVLPCGHCRMCRSGREHCCLELKQVTGTLCEYIVWKYTQLIKLPKEIPLRTGCLAEPMTAVLQAMEKADIHFGEYVAIFGGGFTGLMFTQLAKMRGAHQITVIEPLEERRKLALSYGADHVVDPNRSDCQILLSDITDFTGFDKIIETSSSFPALNLAIKSLARGGMLVSFTYYSYYQKTSVNMMQMYLDNLTVCSSFLSSHKLDLAAQMLPKLRCEELITMELPFSQADYAYHLEKEKQHIKIAIKL